MEHSFGGLHSRKPFKKGSVPRHIGRTKGWLNCMVQAVCDGEGKPLILLLCEGQGSDYQGAAHILTALPSTNGLIADKGYHNDWLHIALEDLSIKPRIFGRANRNRSNRHLLVMSPKPN